MILMIFLHNVVKGLIKIRKVTHEMIIITPTETLSFVQILNMFLSKARQRQAEAEM